MTIKTTVTDRIEREVIKEIKFPYFCKYKDYGTMMFHRINSENECLQVRVSSGWQSISIMDFLDNGQIAIAEQITEQEFRDAYNKAMEQINSFQPICHERS